MDPRIQPADRLKAVSEYYFSRKLKQIAALNAAGADIVSLGIGGPDMMPPRAAIEAAEATLERTDTHSYQMTVGLPRLRQAFVDWYERFYHVAGLNPDTEVLPLIGSKEGVLNVAMAFLNPGDGVLVPNPGYPTYSSASRLVQAEIFTYDLLEENGWEPDFEAMEKLPLERIKIMWVNYPHMPTGTPATKELFEKIVAFARRHGILVINDNPYSFILNEHPLSILQIEGARDVAIEFNSLSKCMNMAGWRVGMVIGDATYLSWILKVKSNIDSGQPRCIMEGAIAALNGATDEWYRSLNKEYAARQKVGMQIMEALGCDCRSGQQGLFLWGRIPEGEVSGEAFADRVLEKARVFITPGFIFGSNGDRFIRISMCAPESLLNKALKRIQSCL